jgi:hypothetical protein
MADHPRDLSSDHPGDDPGDLRADHPTTPRRERLVVAPALPPGDVVFLAGFGRLPVHDHRGRARAMPRRTARIWPGQPVGPCPWVPCAQGCCLHLAGRTGVAAAGAWLRFLLAEFLDATHELSGTVEVPGPGRRRAVLIVDRADVFEGELDDPGGGGRHDQEPWSG